MTTPQRASVLILDDDPGILSLIAARLAKLPIHLVQCTELEAAETLLDHMPFAVLIADLEVSELGGLEGIRVIRHTVTNFSQTEVVVFSGNVTPYAYQLATGLGVSAVFEKPGDLGRMIQLVATLTADPFADPESENEHQLTSIEPLEEVIDAKDVSTVFQPIVSLGGSGSPDALFGLEALSRGPARSFLRNPMILFDYAVRKELVFKTDTLCIATALEAATEMSTPTRLFVNTHPRALSHPDYPATLASILDSHQVPHERIVLEITEQSAILDTKALAGVLEQVRRKGVQIALDDFGEGASNLHLIHELRPEFLKITGLFCDGIDQSKTKQAVVKSSVALCRDLGIRTVMERVETERELAMVRELGIDFVQGYHLGKPLPARELITAWPEALSANEAR